MSIEVRQADDQDRQWIRDLLRDHWGSPMIVSRGRVQHADRLPGVIALEDGIRVGLLTYAIEGRQCQIVSLDAVFARKGIGTALLEAVRRRAAAAECRRLWLVTTNDNLPAIRFYEQRDFRRVAVHVDAVRQSRKLKPDIPEIGVGGVPIRDEIEYELTLP